MVYIEVYNNMVSVCEYFSIIDESNIKLISKIF